MDIPHRPAPTDRAFDPSVNSGESPGVLVLGLGNSLLGDDGAGVKVVERLKRASSLPANASLVDGGTLNFSLLEHIEDADVLVLVDAAQMDAPEGTVRVFENDAMDRFLLRGRGGSVHEVGFSQLCDMARLRGNLPARRFLVAIQPAVIDWNDDLSAAVEQAVTEASDLVQKLIEEFIP